LIDSSNAIKIIENYDVILDASDNVATRYLINDACVICNRPLVSGSALKFEGQLMVYNYKNKSSTYRCVYPKPPPAASVTNCSDGGVLGVVPGIIGNLQALEAIKIIIDTLEPTFVDCMLIFDGISCSFRKIKMRKRNDKICEEICKTGLVDYLQFCGVKAADDKDAGVEVLSDDQRVDVDALSDCFDSKTVSSDPDDKFLSSLTCIIDVRNPVELSIISPFEKNQKIPFKNIPLSHFKNPHKKDEIEKVLSNEKSILFVCRRGNDSQLAVKNLVEKFGWDESRVKDLKGGYTEWSERIDKSLPIY